MVPLGAEAYENAVVMKKMIHGYDLILRYHLNGKALMAFSRLLRIFTFGTYVYK